MANVANAFAALLGAGEAQGSVSKKKNKNKSKQTEQKVIASAELQPADVPAPYSNGHSKADVTAVVDAYEATAILERAAREARSISDKCKLWKDWARQVNECAPKLLNNFVLTNILKQGSDRSGKGIRYKSSDDVMLDFKQVLVRSKALEISIESSLVAGLTHEHHESLVQLLTVFFPSSGNIPQALTTQLVRLAGLLLGEAPDTLGAAQRAVHSVVAALKSAVSGQPGGETDAASGWLSRIEAVDKDIGRQQGLLQKLAATNGGVVTKEQLSCAKAVYKLSEEKFNMLQTENLPSLKPASGPADATSKALAELKGVVDHHLKDASLLEDSAKGKSSSAEAQRLQTMAAYRREESIVTQEAVAVAAQMRTLEAQLRALKSKQTELEDRKAQLQKQSRAVGDSAGSNKAGGGRLTASHYRDEMAVIQALDELLSPGQQSSPVHIVSMQQTQAHAPLDYVASGSCYLELAVASLVELPNRLTFCKQRMSQADKLMALGAVASAAKKEEAEKLLADYMRSAEELMKNCIQVVSDLNQRYDVISRGPDAAAEALRAVDALNAQVRSAYDNVQVSYRAPLVEVIPVPRPQSERRGPAAANGQAGTKRPAGANASHTRPTTVPVAAAAPAAAAAVVSAPAPAPAGPPRPAGPPPKQWGRVQAVAPVDDGEPTPAEAALAAASDGFKEVVAVKKNKKKEVAAAEELA